MSANVDAMLREGINAYKTGRKEDARVMLLKVTELDQYNEQAWLWLSGLMDAPNDQRTCLENVLAINPNNERAKQGLSYLTGQTSAGNVSPFAASSPPPAPSPYSSAAPSSVEWAAPDEPVAATPAWNRPPPVEPTPATLDDWVSNLNLQGGEMQPATVPTSRGGKSNFQPVQTSPFGDFDFNEDDTLDSGPFSASNAEMDAVGAQPAPTRRGALPPARPPERRMSPVEGTRRARPAPARAETSRYEMASTDEELARESGQSEMFGYIPPEIVATRLPGTRERTPILLTLGVILLILFNLALAVILMLSLLT